MTAIGFRNSDGSKVTLTGSTESYIQAAATLHGCGSYRYGAPQLPSGVQRAVRNAGKWEPLY